MWGLRFGFRTYGLDIRGGGGAVFSVQWVVGLRVDLEVEG